MKIILSRKGFDSGYGGQPSPILPDGTLLSFPIPSKSETIKYTDLHYKNKTYYDIISELKPGTKIKSSYTCHLDPDLRKDSYNRLKGWKPLFGQRGGAQGHLAKNGVKQGDLFLFFGWFKETETIGNRLRYKKGAPDLHVIFGYMETGRIYTGYKQLPGYAEYHPHAVESYMGVNYCIYEASARLSMDSSMPGAGCLDFHMKRVLTREGCPRSRWDLPEFFKEVNITYHTKDSFKNGYFDSAKKGQEFIIDCNEKITEWAADIIRS